MSDKLNVCSKCINNSLLTHIYVPPLNSFSVEHVKNKLDSFSRMDEDRDGYVTEHDLATSVRLLEVDLHLSALNKALNPARVYHWAKSSMKS